MAGEARDEEATWRDLVAHYSTPAADGAAPWPVREELSGARPVPPGAPDPAGPPGSMDTAMDTTDAGGASTDSGTPRGGDPRADGDDPGEAQPQRGRDPAPGVIPLPPPPPGGRRPRPRLPPPPPPPPLRRAGAPAPPPPRR